MREGEGKTVRLWTLESHCREKVMRRFNKVTAAVLAATMAVPMMSASVLADTVYDESQNTSTNGAMITNEEDGTYADGVNTSMTQDVTVDVPRSYTWTIDTKVELGTNSGAADGLVDITAQIARDDAIKITATATDADDISENNTYLMREAGGDSIEMQMYDADTRAVIAPEAEILSFTDVDAENSNTKSKQIVFMLNSDSAANVKFAGTYEIQLTYTAEVYENVRQ